MESFDFVPDSGGQIETSVSSLLSKTKKVVATGLNFLSYIVGDSVPQNPLPQAQFDTNDIYTGGSVNGAKVIWTDQNVGITGTDLVGKSSLINALRQIKENGVGAAPVTEDGTNMRWQTYAHPHIPNLKFHEIPYGHVRISWLSKLDVVCVLIGDRLLSTDVQMLRQLQTAGTPFLLLRTKADLAIRQVKRRQKEMSDEQAKVTLRRDLMTFLRSTQLNDQLVDDDIFFISSWEIADGKSVMDEDKLLDILKEKCPLLKQFLEK